MIEGIIVAMTSACTSAAAPVLRDRLLSPPEVKIWRRTYIDGDSESLRLNFDLKVKNLKEIPCSINCYFGLLGGEKLLDTNNSYRATDGTVATSKEFRPRFKEDVIEDIEILIPWSELHIPAGEYHLEIKVQVRRSLNSKLFTQETIRMKVVIRDV